MKKFVFLFLVSLFLLGCYTRQRNCMDFRTGTFVSETYLNGELVMTKFVRNDSIEIDYFQGDVDTFSVRWLNDCEYILDKLHPENRIEDSPIYFTILSTKKNGVYTYEYSEVGGSKKLKGSARKVSE